MSTSDLDNPVASHSKKSHQNEEFILFLDQTGTFPKTGDKQYTVHAGDSIRIVLDSQLLRESFPLLLTNFPTFSPQKNNFIHPVAPIFDEESSCSVTEQELNKKYKVFKGGYNKEGSWEVDLQIGDFDGSLLLQVIFATQDRDQELLIKSHGEPEWLTIQPRISVNDKPIGMDQLIIQTVLPYSLGDSKDWVKILSTQTDLGYNAFHFPPIQMLGESGSYYAIKDHLLSNQDLFKGEKEPFSQIKDIVNKLEKEHNALSFIDILLNHTSFDSEWLLDLPQAVYNPQNTPSLSCALELDEAIQNFSDQLSDHKLLEYNEGSNIISNDQQLDQIMELLKDKVFYALKLEEYFLFDIPKTVESYRKILTDAKLAVFSHETEVDEDENIFSKTGFTLFSEFLEKNTLLIGAARKGLQLDAVKLVEMISQQPTLYSIEALKFALDNHNKVWLQKCKEYIEQAIQSTRGQIRYRRIETNHPEITRNDCLVSRYFSLMKNGVYAANNGWIMNHDPLKNFAEDNDFHYFRRTICIWGDLIKLRYGNQKSDSPGLWKRMKKYVQEMADIFHGFRLDNAHSTPLIVGEYFMRKARNVNKNLMVFAELFTGDGQKDAIFCKRIGINALVRELNQNKTQISLYGNLHWLSRSQEVSVGTLKHLTQYDLENPNAQRKILTPHQTKSVVYDQSHDNEATLSIFSHRHLAPIIALSSFSHFIQGTVRGFDELYPEKLSVVSERRKYKQELNCTIQEVNSPTIDVGIKFTLQSRPYSIQIKGSWDNWDKFIEMNALDYSESGPFSYLASFQVSTANKFYEYKFFCDGNWICDSSKPIREGNNYFEVVSGSNKVIVYDNLCIFRKKFIEFNLILNLSYPFIYYSHHSYGFLSVMRENPEKDSFYFLITRTALDNIYEDKVNIEIECPGIIQQIESIYWVDNQLYEQPNQEESEYLNGLKTKVYEENNILKYAEIKYKEESKKHVISFFKAPSSLTIVLKCSLHNEQKQGIERLNYMLNHIQDKVILDLYHPLNVSDINFLFFSSEHEEHERSGYGMYTLPNKGPLLFGGFGAVFADVRDASLTNDLGRPLFANLREGYWYLDYIVGRLKKVGGNLEKITEYISSYFDLLKSIPKYLIPNYFCQFIQQVQVHLQKIIHNKLKGGAEQLSSKFHQNLLQASYQFLANLPSNKCDEYKISMSAGLPHFSVGWSRSWGRDTFISLRGCMLIPGLFEEAKSIICMFATTLRHGLIPNLLDNGHNPRYNCRDGCWWLIKGISDYIEFTKDVSILKTPLKMKFHSDNFHEHIQLKQANETKIMLLQDVIYDIFSKHARGIKFREWRAGWEIDSNMDNDGFNIQLKLDEQTGFILGGNHRNCLTWMDKMGSSGKAGNKGLPATSRDGAPIEMTCILKRCLQFVLNTPEFPYKEVTTSSGKQLSFKEWNDLIQKNFEVCYWVPEADDKDTNSNNHKYINRRGIYKDLHLSCNTRCDYLLRSNVSIGISLAPELFTPQNAISHIQTVEKVLIEKDSIGLKTLDVQAQEYVSYYNNSDDGIQPKTAHGFSYHNGPEWVWGYGYHLKALVEMNSKHNYKLSKEKLMSYLANHKKHIQQSEWLSLPEMTNQNGDFCSFSCPSQAWSIATILEVCYDSINL